MKRNLIGLSRNELGAFIAGIGEKPFRTKQIWTWLYSKGAADFNGMSNLSKSLREKLGKIAKIDTLTLEKVTKSKQSATKKLLWRLHDGALIESVYIPEGKRRTVCISTQVGCRLSCTFCATGSLGCSRNLSPFEIVDQVLGVIRSIGEKPTNIVVMGMGEPFHNYESVMKALSIINDSEGIAISHRKITLSTVGIVPAIERYTAEGHPYKLAISLNATDDQTRSGLMPINKKYPLEALIKAARLYTRKSRKRLTFEYVLLSGINDTQADANRLLKLLRNIPCKVNLIAYNRTQGDYKRPDEARIQSFAEAIRPLCAPVTLRLSRGDDIGGACGQLIAELSR